MLSSDVTKNLPVKLDFINEDLDDESTKIYNLAYVQAENELIKLGELSDSSLGIKYCQQAAEKAVLEYKINNNSQFKSSKSPKKGTDFVKQALALKQLASSCGQEDVFEKIRIAMLLAWCNLYVDTYPKDEIVIRDTDWIGSKAEIAQQFLDLSVGDLVNLFLEKAGENKTYIAEVLLKAALKNARMSKKKVVMSTLDMGEDKAF